MKILGIDSSGMVASVALMEDEQLIAEYTVNYKKTHSQTLLPMLEEIRRMTELELHSIDAVAVAKGPGSFTGLRIGCATAKGLGMALDKPLVGVPTVDGLAFNAYGSDKIICPIMDARRGQVYTGIYEFLLQNNKQGVPGAYALEIRQAQCAVPVEEIAGKLNSTGREVLFLGDGVPVFRNALSQLLTVPYSFAPAHMNRQRAACIAVLGGIYFQKGIMEKAADHKPEYLRIPQAERERMERRA